MSGSCRAGSAIAVESGRALDGRILPDFAAWDIRRYGSTQVALLVVPGSAEAVDEEGDRDVPATEDDPDE